MENQAAAIILAGGRSARMGRDKATLPIGDRSLIERAVAELRTAFSPIIVVAAPAVEQPSLFDPEAAGVTLVRDRRAFEGPVGALRAGLAAANRDCAFAAACDLPMLDARVALELCAMLDNHDAVVPRVGGRLQMLHAAYQRRCLDRLAAMEREGERRLHILVERIRTRIVEEPEMRLIDPRLESFVNINTPPDYRSARAAIERS